MKRGASGSAALVVVVLAVAVWGADGPPLGFYAEQRVREATRLDWEFVAGAEARLPAGYDSRRLRYQLFVPQTYRATSAWPLVVFVSPGDAPLGWKTWEQPCEDSSWLFAAPVGAGNDCPMGQRVRSVCDVLDDVRHHYRVDPDRTYLAGFGGGAEMAFRLATTLPEHFGGVILMGGDGELPGSDHLRERLRERLSVALVCGSADRVRARLEKFQLPLLTGLGVRARLWVVPDHGHTLPPPAVLAEVQRWLDEDTKRRLADSRRQGVAGNPTESRFALAGRALSLAKKELLEPAHTYRAAARLKWLAARFGPTQAGQQAQELLKEVRDNPVSGRRLHDQSDAASRRLILARAAAMEKSGRLPEARRAWEAAGKLADSPAGRRRSAGEVRRLVGLMARTPYLGLTLEGDTTLVRSAAAGGPAQKAGLRPRDRLEQVGGEKVDGPDAVRRRLERCKPGDDLEVVVSRQGRAVTVAIRVGAVPAD
jgi:predicted esterase